MTLLLPPTRQVIITNFYLEFFPRNVFLWLQRSLESALKCTAAGSPLSEIKAGKDHVTARVDLLLLLVSEWTQAAEAGYMLLLMVCNFQFQQSN